MLVCGSGNPVNTANGLATFTGCAIDQAGPDYRLVATVNTMKVITGSVDATASTTLTGVGTKFLTELTVGDRLTVSGETRTITVIASDISLTVDVATTDTANDTSVDRLPAALIDTSSAFDVTVGVAHHLAFTTSPGGGTGGTDFAVQPVVVVQDRGGNTIANSPATIALQVTAGYRPRDADVHLERAAGRGRRRAVRRLLDRHRRCRLHADGHCRRASWRQHCVRRHGWRGRLGRVHHPAGSSDIWWGLRLGSRSSR